MSVASGCQEVTDHRPGVERDASRACAFGARPERRIAAVEQQQATRLESCKMLNQKLALVLLIGSDEGIEDEAVERILGDPRQGGGITGNIWPNWAIASGVSGRRNVDPSMARRSSHRRTGASWYQRWMRWRLSSMNAVGLSFCRAAQNALFVTTRLATSPGLRT